MQTFLPYDDFKWSAQVLDWRRLGKQRVESKQILNVLTGVTTGWANHPAVLMWHGHEDALKLYMQTMIDEWIHRGYNNTMSVTVSTMTPVMPVWFGDPTFHASHRSNLLRKDPGWYSQFGWSEPPTLPYVWPVRKK